MDGTDAGRLIAFALDVTAEPGNSGQAGDYRNLLDRYRTDASFRRLVDDILEGAGCFVAMADPHRGLLLDTDPGGPWAWPQRTADLPWNKNFENASARAMRLLVPVALLAYVAPSAADFDELLSDPAAVTTTCTATQLAQFITDYARHKESEAMDPAEGEVPLWWHWLQLPAHVPTAKRAGRRSAEYLVHEVLAFLHGQRLVVKSGGTTVRDSIYRPRRLFLARCRAMLADDLLGDLQAYAAKRPTQPVAALAPQAGE
ncbi:hypothetical protein ACFCWG_29280 [Streptomyces sp. NPDC056390]|uniref:hypothetical protein n=1 Tax=Streptomyces sp. NPDC056390 TaxID=3345806 RepID=UPI0035DF6D7F